MNSTVRSALKWTAGLIGLYLVVNYSGGFGTDINASTTGGANVIKTLQGRG